ncbi:TPA: hypothetical protein ACJJEU_002167, partial [Neisseria meningitidis]
MYYKARLVSSLCFEVKIYAFIFMWLFLFYIWVWFEEAGDYRFLSSVLKIVSFSADFRHFFIGVGYLYWHGASGVLIGSEFEIF